MTETLPPRDQIETRYKWNAESVFPTPAGWDAEASAVAAETHKLQRFQGRLRDTCYNLSDVFKKNLPANALAKRIRAGAPGAVDDYLKFLKSGNVLYPIDALKVAGVDMTTPAPVEAAFEVLAGYVDRLEKLVE